MMKKKLLIWSLGVRVRCCDLSKILKYLSGRNLRHQLQREKLFASVLEVL